MAISCYLAGSAVLFRVLPNLLPTAPMALPNRITVYLFGFSSILGWLAVAVLAVNLWMTMRRAPP